MDEKVSRTIAETLLQSESALDIQKVIRDPELAYWFENDSNWKPYGGREKNWDTVGNQQANAVGSLVELITNAIDAILLRKAREEGLINCRSAEAPQSMFDAVKRYFPHVVEGRIANLGPKQRTELAEKCVIIGVKRASRVNSKYPTYTIIDRGDGQLPDEFPKTFLSLSERNKEGIPFVQGKFNMGSTGSLRFCTSANINLGHFKFLISRRPDQKYWGWTLIRVRKHRVGESLPVAEYFCPAGQIPRFRAESLQGLGHHSIGVVSDGTVIKLYEYDVGAPAHTVDIGLYDALTVSLVDCALPVRVYDFDAKPVENKGELRKEGIAARTFSGMNATLVNEAEENTEDGGPVGAKDTEWQHLVLEDKTEDLGIIKIVATGVKHLKDYLQRQPARVFYTVNGQRHAIERASFLNTRVGLGDIRNHVIINVICDRMDTTALSNIFMPDRERKVDNNQSRQLEDTVIQALKNDDKLRAYAAEIRLRRATEYVGETAESKELLEELVKTDPDIKELFGLGTLLTEISMAPGGAIPFAGKKFPTILNPMNLKPEGNYLVKEVPINAYRRIECGTDADNEYLSRIDSPGETWCSLPPDMMPHSVKVRNGTATFTVKVPTAAKVGDTCFVEFGFLDNGRNAEPLKFGVLIRYLEAETSVSKSGGKKSGTTEKVANSLALPRFDWVSEADWDNHSFKEGSGAYVDMGESTVVYVNRDNKSLKLMRMKEKDEAARQVFETMFKYGVGIFALSIHRKADSAVAANAAAGQTNSIDTDEMVRVATEGIAPHIITVIKRLGGGDLVR